MAVFRYLYAPLYFFGFVGGATALVSSGSSPAWLFVLIIASIGTSLAAERIAPFENQWNSSHGDGGRDILHAVVNEGSLVAMVLLLPLITSLVPWDSAWPTTLPLWADVAIAIVLLDVGITLAHFASHRVSFLWRFHAVHHSVRRMYGFNGLLKHPVHQFIEVSAGAFPWLLLGIPLDVAAVASFAVLIQLQLQHSNVDMRVGPLASPSAPPPRIRNGRRRQFRSLLDALGCSAWYSALWVEPAYQSGGDWPRWHRRLSGCLSSTVGRTI